MGLKIKTIILFIATAFLSACTSNGAPVIASTSYDKDIASITALYKTWNTAVEAGDREGYLGILDDNIRMVPPGAADIIGKQAYAQFLIPVFANAQYEIVYLNDLQIEIISPDIAVARYDYIIDVTMNSDVEKITESDAALDQASNNTKYHDVLKRQTDGSWRVLRHMWNDGHLSRPSE